VHLRLRVVLVAWALGASGAWWAARGARQSARPASSSVLGVPRAASPVALDGDTDDPAWLAAPGPARTGAFVGPSGAPARPHAEARLLWGQGMLYVLLYAADEDVTRADRFVLTFAVGRTAYAVAVGADGAVNDQAPTGWRSGMHVSREIDGTLDDPRDVDEEWSLEIAVPLASLGLRGARGERLGFGAARCDASGCSRWGDGGARSLVLD
jgi:hypothetical protein